MAFLADLEWQDTLHPAEGYGVRVLVACFLVAEGFPEASACRGAEVVPTAHDPEFRGYIEHMEDARTEARKALHDGLHARRDVSYRCRLCSDEGELT